MPHLPHFRQLGTNDLLPSALHPRAFAPPRSFLRSLTDHAPFPEQIAAGLSGTGAAQPSQASLESLKDFLRSFFLLEIGKAAEAQLLVTACFIGLMLFLGLSIVGYKLWKGKFWVFRFTRRAEGIYIVPNALNCFLLLEGCYGVILICYNTITWQLYRNDQTDYIHGIFYWSTLTWIPLYIGAFWAGWGSFYTAPGALDRTNSTDRGRVDRILGMVPKPIFINMVSLGTPFLLVASIVPPSILAQNQLDKSWAEYLDWRIVADGLTANAGAFNSAAAQDILDRADTVWNGVSTAYYYLAIAYALWSFWALVFLAFYIPAGGYLVFLLWQQVKKQQKALFVANQRQAMQQQTNTMSAAPGGQAAAAVAPSDGSDTTSENTARPSMATSKMPPLAGFAADSPKRFQPLALPADGADPAGRMQPTGSQDSSTAVPDDGLSPPNSPVAPRVPRRTVKEEVRDIFFPPLRPDIKRLATRRLSSHISPSSRFKYLRRCLVNLVVLYTGIVAAAISFSFVTIRLAAHIYEAASDGPRPLAIHWREGQLVAAYASCVFGFLTIGSIALRSFDSDAPSRDNSSRGSGNKGKRARFARNARNDSDDEKRHVGEKTRTLPAVPESVGIDTTQHDLSRLREGDELVSGIKFQLATDGVHRGAIVLRPDDPLNSSASLSPELEQYAGSPHASPQLSSTNNSPKANGGTNYGGVADKSSRKHGTLVGSRAGRPWAAVNGRVLDDITSVPQDEFEASEQASIHQVYYPTPYGVVAGPSSSNGHGSLLSQPVSPRIDRTASYTSLAQIAAKHAEEQRERREREDSVQSQLQQQADGTRGFQQPRPASHEAEEVVADEDDEAEDENEDGPPVERTWVRRSSRSGVVDSAAAQIAREWQASQYMHAPLPHTPPPPPASTFLADLPLDDPNPSSTAHAHMGTGALLRRDSEHTLFRDGDTGTSRLSRHGDVFGTPMSKRSLQISQAEAILLGGERTSISSSRRPSQQLLASELLAHGLAAPLEPSPPSKRKAATRATQDGRDEDAILGSPASTASQRLRQSPGVFF